jgi:hypothetical protein
MLFATLGLLLVIVGGMGALRGALVLLAVSVATKFVTLPLLGIVALLRLARTREGQIDLRKVIGQWIVDAVAIIAVILAAFLPFWEGYETIHEMLAEPSRLFAHPIWRIGEALLLLLPTDLFVDIYRTIFRYGMQILTFSVFAYVTWHFIQAMTNRRSSGVLKMEEGGDEAVAASLVPWWTRPLLVAWVIILVTLSMLPVNAHPWYWTWPVVPIALLVTMDLKTVPPEERPDHLPRLFKWYLVATAVMTLIYHTRIARY